MKNLDLSDAETAALIDVLRRAIVADRYPLSPRVLTLVGILDKLRPEPARATLPPPKVYAPPRAVRKRREGRHDQLRKILRPRPSPGKSPMTVPYEPAAA
jgi:hypothetical protein